MFCLLLWVGMLCFPVLTVWSVDSPDEIQLLSQLPLEDKSRQVNFVSSWALPHWNDTISYAMQRLLLLIHALE